MGRRRRAVKRIIPSDPRFNSVTVARFINKVMERGKKSVAQRIVYRALEKVAQDAKQDALEVFSQAMKNVTPALEVKPRRVGGATYQIPVEVRPNRQEALAMRWIISAAHSRGGRPMAQKLAEELLEASKGQGAAVKRKEDLYKMAEANRAFVHYRW